MPFALNGQRYAQFLPNAEAIRLDRDEGHFLYLDAETFINGSVPWWSTSSHGD